jgi:FAD/FMN-containing dehydrogenase
VIEASMQPKAHRTISRPRKIPESSCFSYHKGQISTKRVEHRLNFLASRLGVPIWEAEELAEVPGTINTAILSEFKELLGPKSYIDDADAIAPWLTDWRGLYTGKCAAVVSPASTQEVSAVVRLAAKHKIALVPQGGNTSMVGGATPEADGRSLILSLRRMNQIRAISLDAMSAQVDAGVILANLHDAARAQGLRFPLSLGAKGSATIGGLVSTNAGGTQVLRFGTMRRLVLGLEAVLPDGSVFSSMAALKKDNRGYDLTQLLIGGEGTIGVVTGATLQLVPDITDRAVAWVAVEDPYAALRLLRRLERASGDAIESFEVVRADAMGFVLSHIAGARAPLEGAHPWYALIEFVATDKAAQSPSAHLEVLLADALSQALILDAAIATSEAQAEAFWRLRDSVSEAERAQGPAMQHDISVPVDDMPRFMVEAARAVEERFPGVTAGAFGHLGDGNVHFHVRAPKDSDPVGWRAGQGREASAYVYDLVVEAGGSISAEHGIGQMKRDELTRLSDPVRMKFLRAIKNALDPQGIMNPNKLLPLASNAEAP